MKLFEWVRSLFTRKQQQTCWTYCPRCRFELTSSRSEGSVVYDQDRLVWYTCEGCGLRTRWDFDSPAPVIVFVEDFDAWLLWMDDKIDRFNSMDDLHKWLNLRPEQYRLFCQDPKSFYALELDKHTRSL